MRKLIISLFLLQAFNSLLSSECVGPYPENIHKKPIVLMDRNFIPVVTSFYGVDPPQIPLLLSESVVVDLTQFTSLPLRDPWVTISPLGSAPALATHASEPNALYFFEEAIGRLRKAMIDPDRPFFAQAVQDVALLPPASFNVAGTRTAAFPGLVGSFTQNGNGWSARGFSMDFHQDSLMEREYLYIAINQYDKADSFTHPTFPEFNREADASGVVGDYVVSKGDKTPQHGIYRLSVDFPRDRRQQLPWSKLIAVSPAAGTIVVQPGEIISASSPNVPGEMLTILWNQRANVAYVTIKDQSGDPFEVPPAQGKGALITLDESGKIIDKWTAENGLFNGTNSVIRTGIDGLAFDPNRGSYGVLFIGNFNQGKLLTVQVDRQGIPIKNTLNEVFTIVSAPEFTPIDGSVSGMQLARSKVSRASKGLYFASRLNEFSNITLARDRLLFLDFRLMNPSIDSIINGGPGLGNVFLDPTAPPFINIHTGIPYSSASNIVFGQGKNCHALFISNTSNTYSSRRAVGRISSGLAGSFSPNICVHKPRIRAESIFLQQR